MEKDFGGKFSVMPGEEERGFTPKKAEEATEKLLAGLRRKIIEETERGVQSGLKRLEREEEISLDENIKKLLKRGCFK